MSRKLIVLPYNLYQSLLREPVKSPKPDLMETGPLERASRALLGAKRVHRGEDLSARNIQHQQQLRSYLRARRAVLDKPISVEMQGLRALLDERQRVLHLEEEEEAIELPPATPHRRRVVPPRSAGRHRFASTPAPERIPTGSSSSATTYGSVGDDGDVFGPAAEEEPNEDVLQPGTSMESPRISRQQRLKAERAKTDTLIRELTAHVIDHVQKNPGSFGVTSDGKKVIGRDQKPMARSNVQRSIHYLLLAGQGSAAGSPPVGVSTIQPMLEKDPVFQNARDLIRTTIRNSGYRGYGKGKRNTTITRKRRNPLMLRHLTGIPKKKQRDQQFCPTIVFRPTLWRPTSKKIGK